MRKVILESPFAANQYSRMPALLQRWLNKRYARSCMRDSLVRGEAPIASHLLYPQRGILRDSVPEERQWGIDAGLAWGSAADATVVYVDRDISKGMRYGILAAKAAGRPIEYRAFLDGERAVEVDPGLMWQYVDGVVVAPNILDEKAIA